MMAQFDLQKKKQLPQTAQLSEQTLCKKVTSFQDSLCKKLKTRTMLCPFNTGFSNIH
jgi:hypothetical protein